ncbi:MAG: glycosyl hydrolase [Candidatus Helarchaeota archaeon]
MDFIANFKDPPKTNSPFPFWFLNDDLSEEDLTRALEEFKAKHIYSVVLHQRTGFEIEYLSEEFWAKIGFILRKCKELDLKVILYDEYNWPSGTMGGRLIREHPEFKQRYLNYTIRKQKSVQFTLEGDYIVAFEVNPKEGRVRELVANFDGIEFHWVRPGKGWEVIIFYTCTNDDKFACLTCSPFSKNDRGYIDLLNPDAVRYFIQHTHEEYKKRFSPYFGNTIIAIFSDEPGNYKGLMWTNGFLEKFQNYFKFDLKKRLYQLVYTMGPDYLELRYSYYTFVHQMYVQVFYKQMGDWCAKNQIAFTGHLIMEDDLKTLPKMHGGLFLPLREMHIPGIDYLGDKTGYDLEETFFSGSPNFAPKLISSITHHLNLKRNVCEIFGGCGWPTTLERLKRVVAWITCCGVNWINQHGSHLSLKGLRKRDYPASHFLQEPWWKYYAIYTDFVSRLCYFNSLGVHVANFCILFPKTALNLHYSLYKKEKIFYQIAEYFPRIGDILLRIQCDFDYLFEDQILEETIRIEDGQLKTQNEQYSVLIIPPIDIIPVAIYQFLSRFYQQGGYLLFLGKIPTNSERALNDKAIAKINQALFGEELPVKDEYITTNSTNGKIIFVPLKILKNKKNAERYFEILFNKYNIPRDIMISTDKRHFIYQHRRFEEADYYEIVNLSSEEVLQNIQFNKDGHITILYPESGEIYRLAKPISNGALLKNFKFNPNECVIFSISRQPLLEYKLLPPPLLQSELPPITIPSNWQITPLKPNLFLLDNWDCKILERKPPSQDEIDRDNKIWTNLSFRMKLVLQAARPFIKFYSRGKVKNSRFSTSKNIDKYGDLVFKILGINKYEDFAGFRDLIEIFTSIAKRVGFRTRDFEPGDLFEVSKSFNIEFLPDDDITLIYEDLGLPLSLELNGHYLEYEALKEQSEKCFVWDASNRKISVKSLLKLGENNIRIQIQLPDYPDLLPACHGLEPFVLQGHFSTRGNSIVAPITTNKQESWVKTGLATYAGAVVYKNSFYLPQKYLAHQLILKFRKIRETVEVKINGEHLGTRIWMPFQFDITNYIKKGENSIELEIRNTAENFFGEPKNSGLLDDVIILPYKKS